MEVASPLPFQPSGSKRPFSFPVQRMDSPGCGGSSVEDVCDPSQQRSVKRRRFFGDTTTESTSPFQSTTFSSNHHILFPTNHQSHRRSRASDAAEHLNRVVEEQAAVIESLKTEKKELHNSVLTLKAENERTLKENHILRRAVQIQQDRQNHAENELKNAVQYREGAEEQIRKMEQMILSLRYHLQAQRSAANDFMGIPPPDVF
ncbi:hypothetical protein ACA910_021758 [Epithemia clementina (nom. ined.)]